jgi:hypothetical protein
VKIKYVAALLAFGVLTAIFLRMRDIREHANRVLPVADYVEPRSTAPKAKIEKGSLSDVSELPNAKTSSAPELPEASAPVRGRAAIPPEAKFTSELRNRGNHSAADAAKTFLWAALSHETDLIAGLIHWTWARPFDLAPGTPLVASTIFQTVPESWRQLARTPERLLAFAHQNEVESFGAFQVVDHRILGPDTEQVVIRLFDSSGNSKEQSLLMQRTQNGWKRVHWPVTLETLAKRLRELPPK